MISTIESKSYSPLNNAVLISIDRGECHRQIALAEREVSAFFMTVRTTYGDDVAVRAVDDWIALAGSLQAPLFQGFPNWRYITILASSRLAMNHCGYKPQVGLKEVVR